MKGRRQGVGAELRRWLLYGALGIVLTYPVVARVASAEGRKVVAIRVVGNRHTKPWVITRELRTRVGDVPDSASLAEDRDRVFNLRLFERVEVRLAPGPLGDTLVVQVWERWYIFPFPILFISERDVRKFSYGAGIVHLNFAGRAQEVSVVGWAGYNPSVRFNYFNPWLGGRHRLFCRIGLSSSSIRSKSLEVQTYREKRRRVELVLGKRYGYGVYLAVGTFYTDRRVVPYVPGVILSPSGRDRFGSVVGQVLFDWRDVRAYPWNGSYFEVLAIKNGLGSRWVDYKRLEVDFRGYWGPGAASLSGRATATLSFGEVPNYDRVFFGYRERVRGHFFEKFEGDNRMLFSLEWRRVLLPLRYWESPLPESLVPTLKFGLNLALFADAGVVWRRGQSPRHSRWLKGFGAGLHIRLPYIEALRLEVASDERGNLQGIVDVGAFF